MDFKLRYSLCFVGLFEMNVVVMVLFYTNMRLWQRAINTDGGPSNLMPSQEPNSVQFYTAAYKISILCESHGS